MKKFYVLTERALRIIKQPGVKGQILDLFGLNDPRTIDKYISKMYPDSPLLNRNVIQIIKDHAQFGIRDEDILRAALPEELAQWAIERETLKNKKLKKQNKEILKSNSWKITKPLRKISNLRK